MGSELTPNIIAAIIAAIIVAGSVITIILKRWFRNIEEKQNARRELIKSCKNLISSDIPNKEFIETLEYSRLRSYLPEDLIKELEKDPHRYVLVILGGGRGGGVNNFKPQLLDEISKLEKKWNLI